MHINKHEVPVKIDAPGAIARQATGFGDASGSGALAGEYLARRRRRHRPCCGLEDDACQAPHWGYMLAGEVVVTYTDGTEETCATDELFYWKPGHSVRVVDDAEVILFSPQAQHAQVMDHMLVQMGG